MKFHRKLISFLIVLTVLFGSVPASSFEIDLYSDEEVLDYQQKMELFGRIAGVSAKHDIGELVTREEFSYMLVHLFNLRDTGANAQDFADISDTEFKNEVRIAVSNDVLTYLGDGLFHPDDPITLKDLSQGLTVALGYKDIVRDQYPDKENGYVLMAQQKKLLKGIPAKESVFAVTYGEAAKAFYNALCSSYLEYSFSGGKSVYSESEKTFMEDILGFEEFYGVVEATPVADLYAGGELNENQIKISGYTYRYEGNINDLLGYRVKCYRDKSMSDELIYVCIDYSRNTELTVSSKDIVDYKNRKYIYSTKSGGSKSLNVPVGCSIVYNGRAQAGSTAGFDMIPTNGGIKALDNNSDGEYDVIFIESFINLVVGTINTYENSVYDKYDSSLRIILKDIEDKFLTVQNDDGSRSEFKSIKTGDVLSIAQSADGVLTKIIISRNKAEGELKSYSDEEWKVDEASYEPSDDMHGTEMIGVGKKVILYLDKDGYIASYEFAKEDIEAVYLIDAKIARKTDVLTIKVCNQSGSVEKIECAEKIYINNIREKSHETALTKLCDGNGAAIPQILTIKRDESGKVKKLFTVYEGAPDACPDEALMLNSTITDTSQRYIAANRIFMDYKTALSSSCRVFLIPADIKSAENEDFSVLMASELKDDQAYGNGSAPLYAYIMGGRSLLCSYVVAGATLSPRRSSSAGVVKKVVKSYDEDTGNVAWQVTLYSGGGDSDNLVYDKDVDINNIKAFSASVTSNTYKLSKGDLIYYDYDISGGKSKLTKISMVYDYESGDCLCENPSTLNVKDSTWYVADVWLKGSGYLGLALSTENTKFSTPKAIGSGFNAAAENYRVENVSAASFFRPEGTGSVFEIKDQSISDIVDYRTSKVNYSKVIILTKLGRAQFCYIIK